ncbi:AAA family ATPase [Mycolicibacterium lacusdiani]|uniref:AAA family ATPase n=1 Tax=Mycolicibacterium lacusdiani TaxID=2895283 RepID=UPI001F264B15|nr:AAA family ATPase [Mycolicibacterium lacusdiani]
MIPAKDDDDPPEPPMLDITALLELLCYTGDELVGTFVKHGDGETQTAVLPLADVAGYVSKLPEDADVFFGVNPTAGPERENAGRGGDDDATRLAAMVVDLDFEDGKCPSVEVAETIVSTVSGVLGTRPSAITHSGHGWHVYWPVEDGLIGDTAKARAILKRFGRLVAVVAKSHGAKVDNVFQPGRAMRLPGSNNCKRDGERLPVRCYEDTGAPLTLVELDERLVEVGIYEEDGDTAHVDPENVPDAWDFADDTCGYVRAIIDELPTDHPSTTKPGRHPWVVKQAVRLACAVRLGCITENDWSTAQEALHARLVELRRRTREKVPALEVPSTFAWAVEHVATTKTDEQSRDDLGQHVHRNDDPYADVDVDDTSEDDPITGNKTKTRSLTWLSGNDIRDDVPEWAWEHGGGGRAQRATLGLFAGRPGAGKSTAARSFAADYSNGKLEGCFAGKPQHVAYIASEESVEYMVKPSLRAHGADMSRIHFPKVEIDGQEVRLSSRDDEKALTDGLRELGVTVVFVDPIMSSIGSKVNINHNNEVRDYLEPWARIARAINGAVIGIVHLTKAPGGEVVAAINGSSAFGEVARSIIAFAKDQQSDEGLRVLSQEKNSAGPEDLALEYTLTPVPVTTDSGRTANVVRFTILGKSDRRVSDVLQTDPKERNVAKGGTKMLEVLQAVEASDHPVTADRLSPGLRISKDTLGRYLRRLADDGFIRKAGRGEYVRRGLGTTTEESA